MLIDAVCFTVLLCILGVSRVPCFVAFAPVPIVIHRWVQIVIEVRRLAFINLLCTCEPHCHMFIRRPPSPHAVDNGILGNCVDWPAVALLNLLSKLGVAFLQEEIGANEKMTLVYVNHEKASIDGCGLSAYTLQQRSTERLHEAVCQSDNRSRQPGIECNPCLVKATQSRVRL